MAMVQERILRFRSLSTGIFRGRTYRLLNRNNREGGTKPPLGSANKKARPSRPGFLILENR